MPPHANLLKRKRAQASDSKSHKSRPRKFKRQGSYHSSSSEDEVGPIRNDQITEKIDFELASGSDDLEEEEEEVGGVELPNLNGSRIKHTSKAAPQGKDQDSRADTAEDIEDEDEEDDMVEEDFDNDSEDDGTSSSSDSDIASTSTATRALKKRNDPSVFATSISKILNSKLTSTQRSDPILSRSKSASEASKQLAESKLEARAKRKLKEGKRVLNEKGREKDLLGLDREDIETGAVVEKERQLRRTAQRGVVKLFNAVRAAQVKAEDEEKRIRGEGLVGIDKRKERVDEMGKKAFLDLLVEGKG